MRTTRIIAVTGGRDYTDEHTIRKALQAEMALAKAHGLMPVLLTGGCPTGLDELARRFWHEAELPYAVDPARFKTGYGGKSEGPHRNARMATGASFSGDPWLYPDRLIVFPGGRGTRNCKVAFAAMSIPIVYVGEAEEL